MIIEHQIILEIEYSISCFNKCCALCIVKCCLSSEGILQHASQLHLRYSTICSRNHKDNLFCRWGIHMDFCSFILRFFYMELLSNEKKIGLKKGLFIILSRRKPLTALSSFNKCFALCIRVRWNRLQWLKYPKLKFCCTLSYVKLNFNMGLPSYI